MVLLNKKEYSDTFDQFHHEEYFNLKLYPEVGILEQEAGLLTELVEMFQGDCDIELLGASEFLADNVPKCQGQHVITYLNGTGEFNGVIILTTESPDLDHMYKVRIHGLEKVLYIRLYYTRPFFKHFEQYKFEDGTLYFDNLVCLCMIVKNAGPLFANVLEANKPNFDKWCILDTGSTDGTQDVIRRVLADKKGQLYEEPFVNFKVSRNRCLELAGTSCKFLLTLDDTYMVQGDLRSFLSEVRSDQFSDSFSMLIKSGDSEYYSNRIIKSHTGLRYMYTIHEVIPKENNVNVTVPVNRATILDQRSDYMEERTTTRKQFDLELLFKEYEDDPDDPRSLYYIAQTYGCMGDEVNKAKYLKLRAEHPNEGYIQEKVDACFELARCYNFKLDREWKESEEWYQKAFDLDQERPDALYFLGIHWYIENNFARAHEYFKKAFEIGYPIHRQYSLKPTLSFHFLPKFLTETSYYMKDYALGEACARYFFQNNKPDCDSIDLVSSWYHIHSELVKMPPVSQTPTVFPNKVVCIVADGGWSDWTGKDIYTNGVGGSETWVIEIARNMKKNNPALTVVVFCKCKEPEDVDGVGYNPIHMFHAFVAHNVIDVCIVSRYTQYLPVALEGHALEVGVIFHDLIQNETVIPIHPKLKWAFCLTDWHSRYIKARFSSLNTILSRPSSSP
jgi:glycosyltransferase involved in cell wall biosynthesis